MTTTSMVIIGLIIVAVLFGLEISWKSWQSGRAFCTPLPRPYRDRQSQETAWRQRYAGDAMEHADTVLKLICEAFCFNHDNRYQFARDDRILDIYHSFYPRWWFWLGTDCMEIESLLGDLYKKFGFEVSNWHEGITIGEIVDAIASNGAGADVNLPIS
jgi:hypothetical protein